MKVGHRLLPRCRWTRRVCREAHNPAGEPRDRLLFDARAGAWRRRARARRGARPRLPLRADGASGRWPARCDTLLARTVDHAARPGAVRQAHRQLPGGSAAARACSAPRWPLWAARHGGVSLRGALAMRISRSPQPSCAPTSRSKPATAVAHQVHGAIGFTREHDLRHFTQRLLVLAQRVRQRPPLERDAGPGRDLAWRRHVLGRPDRRGDAAPWPRDDAAPRVERGAIGSWPHDRRSSSVTARTAIGRAFRGALNNTHGAALARMSSRLRCGAPACPPTPSTTSCSAAPGRRAPPAATSRARPPLRAGLPVTVPAATLDRKCASGLNAIAIAANASAAARSRCRSPAGSSRCHWCRTTATAIAADDECAMAPARRLRDDDRDGRERRGALRHRPRRAGRLRAAKPAAAPRPRRPRARFDDEIEPFDVVQELRRQARAGHRHGRPCGCGATKATGPTPRAESARRAEARGGRERRGDRGQREPVVRRRFGVRADGRSHAPSASACRCSACGAASRWRVARPTRWASARCSPCRGCCSAMA